MFDLPIDIEQTFEHHRPMRRARVRRRRAAGAFLLVATALFGIPTLAGTAGASGGEPTAAEYVVRSGDTLWDLAVRLRPSSDPRRVVYDIAQLNDIGDAALVPGQVLALPAEG